MNVQNILSQKPVYGVAHVVPGSRVAEAVKLLSEKRIGAVVVSPDGKAVAGILSERDVVRELGKRGAACLDDKVDALMTAKVEACTMTDTAEEVMEMMTNGRFRHMPVIVEGAMVGLISIGDVVKARLAEMDMERHALEDMIKGF